MDRVQGGDSDGEAQKLSEPPRSRREFLPRLRLGGSQGSSAVFEDIELDQRDVERQESENSTPTEPPVVRGIRQRWRILLVNMAWWSDEYFYAGVCIVTAACLGILLRTYDQEVVPELFWGLKIDTAIIAMTTIVRVSLKAFVESSISQGAWIWVSEQSQRRCKHNARLGDFKVFDEASRGLWGSILLIWRMKFRHLACIGAAIIILVHGFETFSQQMVYFDQRPTPYANVSADPAPPPPRAEIWDSYQQQGYLNANLVPLLSTRAAVYSGIIGANVPMLLATCSTGNCTWPIMPTLGACGSCGSLNVSESCSSTYCNYTSPSGNEIGIPMDMGSHGLFKVAPSMGTNHQRNSTERAYFSVFEIMSLVHREGSSPELLAQECALWICLQRYVVSVTDGTQNQTLLSNWSKTTYSLEDIDQGTEFTFVNIPLEFNTLNGSKYSVTNPAVTALRGFMDRLTDGTVNIDVATIDWSSDWIEAIWNATKYDLTSWIDTLATSVTNEIRLQGLTNARQGQNYAGHALQLAPYVAVQWLWVIYPGALIFVSLVYMFRTIIVGARDGVSVWKGDALPMLFCRIDNNIHDKVKNGMDIPDGLDDRVGTTEIALYRGKNGEWAFKTADGED